MLRKQSLALKDLFMLCPQPWPLPLHLQDQTQFMASHNLLPQGRALMQLPPARLGLSCNLLSIAKLFVHAMPTALAMPPPLAKTRPVSALAQLAPARLRILCNLLWGSCVTNFVHSCSSNVTKLSYTCHTNSPGHVPSICKDWTQFLASHNLFPLGWDPTVMLQFYIEATPSNIQSHPPTYPYKCPYESVTPLSASTPLIEPVQNCHTPYRAATLHRTTTPL